MERHRLVLIIAACVATAPASIAQLSPAPMSPPDQSFVVIGDVRNANWFPLSAEHRLTVREAVVNAGLLTDSVTVSVLRGAQGRAQWTQMVSLDSTDSGELVVNSDLLVVQSMTPLAVPIQRNAALQTEAGTIIVTLADESVAIGDVLQQTNWMLYEGQQVNIISRLQGRPGVAGTDLSEKVLHGDVIALTPSHRTVPDGYGGMVRAHSEWTDSFVAALPQDSASVQVPLTIESPSGSAEAAAEAASGYLMQMPKPFDSVPFDAGAPLPADPPSSDRFLDDRPGETEDPLGVRAVSQTSSREKVTESTAQAAPVPPLEIPVSAGTDPSTLSSEISPWNLVFIGGLLIAGTLILAGSLKTDDETAVSPGMIPVQRLIQPTSQPSTAGVKTTQEPSSVAGISGSHPIQAEASPAVVKTAQEASTNFLVPEKSPAEERQTNPVSATEWFSGEWRVVKPAVEADSVIAAVAAVTTQTVVTALDGERHADRQFADLEDLLQNRLPIDLCETRLPLRISLYGRPAGPRRLRIDGAHQQLAGPHSSIAADRRSGSSSVGRETVPASVIQPGSSSGGLDRALHSLQDRIDS